MPLADAVFNLGRAALFVAALGADKMIVSVRGLRFGLLYEMLLD